MMMMQSQDHGSQKATMTSTTTTTTMMSGADATGGVVMDASAANTDHPDSDTQTFFVEHAHVAAEIDALWEEADRLGKRFEQAQSAGEVARVGNDSHGDDAVDSNGMPCWSWQYMERLYRLSKIIDNYQEQPQLLDPHLTPLTTKIIPRILTSIKKHFASPDATTRQQRTFMVEQHRPFFDILAHLVKTCGYKAFVRVWTHEVSDLEPCLRLLEFLAVSMDEAVATTHHGVDTNNTNTNTDTDVDTVASRKVWELWQTRYMMLLWTSLIVMIPFDLTRVDSGSTSLVTKPLVDRLRDIGIRFLDAVGKEYQGASILLMRLLTRRDTSQTHLVKFIRDAFVKVDGLCRYGDGVRDGAGNDTHGVFVYRGWLSVLCAVYKYGPRDILAETAPLYIGVCESLLTKPLLSTRVDAKQGGVNDHVVVRQNALLRKLTVKLAQVVALCALKPRVAVWRYQRGARSLAENLASDGRGSSGNTGVSGGMVTATPKSATDHTDPDVINGDGDDGDDIPEDLENIVGILLDGLRDKDTIVRWTSAKGVGRIANRLNHDQADDIIASVIDILGEDVIMRRNSDNDDTDMVMDSSGVSDASWHGALLALAELVRRGLLLPTRLSQAIPYITHGLSFDQRRGTHSIGAHVRDAACYVCWSIARAYDGKILEPFITTLSTSLCVCALTDRDVGVRRAASAAFQEHVGRHGLFDHGIDVVGMTDYYCLGNRGVTVLEVLPRVAGLGGHGDGCDGFTYVDGILRRVVDVCVSHWDRAMRSVMSKALGALVRTGHATRIVKEVVPNLFAAVNKGVGSRCGESLEARHGGLLAIAEIIMALTETMGEADCGDADGGNTESTSMSARGILTAHRPRIKWPTHLVASVIQPAFTIVHGIHPKYTESFGSDMTRCAALSVMQSLASSCALPIVMTETVTTVPSPESTLTHWWHLIDTSIDRSEQDIQLQATKTIESVASVVGFDTNRRLTMYVHGTVATSDKYRRRGVGMALGVLPLSVMVTVEHGSVRDVVCTRVLDQIVSALVRSVRVLPSSQALLNDAESRRNGVNALTRIICRVIDSDLLMSDEVLAIEDTVEDVSVAATDVAAKTEDDTIWTILRKIVAAMMDATEDYATDARGDVGSMVRSAAVRGLGTLLTCIHTNSQRHASRTVTCTGVDIRDVYQRVVSECDRCRILSCVVVQCVGKIDRVRESAGSVLVSLVGGGVEVPDTHALKTVLFGSGDNGDGDGVMVSGTPTCAINWLSPKDVYPRMIQLVYTRAYRVAILTGMVISIGGMTESIVRYASTSFTDLVKRVMVDCGDGSGFTVTVGEILDGLSDIFERYGKDDRVSVPMLETLDVLFSNANAMMPPSSLDVSVGVSSRSGRGLSSYGRRIHHLVSQVRTEVFKSRVVKKVAVALRVFSSVISLDLPIVSSMDAISRRDEVDDDTDEMKMLVDAQVRCLRYMVGYLVHPYPSIRRASSEMLYVILSAVLPGRIAMAQMDADSEGELLGLLGCAEERLLCEEWDMVTSGGDAMRGLKAAKSDIEVSLEPVIKVLADFCPMDI